MLNKIKKYSPTKYISYLYFSLPLLFFPFINFSKENDIWFLMSYGKYIVNHGFPHFDILSMHSNFKLVIQQWVPSVLFYESYKLLGSLGLIFLVFVINVLIVYFLYKLCLVISNHKVCSSVITSSIIALLLEMNFIVPRPQIFSLLFLIILLYLLESYLKKDTKKIYFLPLISLLLINFHASMWPVFFIFCMPYVALLVVNYFTKKDKAISKLLLMMFLSFLAGFLNPYTIANMTYAFTSYGVKEINEIIIEMAPFNLTGTLAIANYLVLILFYLVCFAMIHTKKVSLHYILLTFGTFYMSLCNMRNFSLFYIASLPFLSSTLNIKDNPKKTKPCYLIYLIIIITFVTTITYKALNNDYHIKNDNEPLVKYLQKENYKGKMKLYADYDNGSYYEFYGYHPYIDARAEIFLKVNNGKEDIFHEYYLLNDRQLDPETFLAKYNFTHLVTTKGDVIYEYLINNSNYLQKVSTDKKSLFEKKA